jgi:myosin heavy subunit
VAAADTELRARLSLPPGEEMESFYYLSQSGCRSIEGLDEVVAFAETT